MGRMPESDPVTGLLPPGRYAVDLETLRETLVEAPHFAESATRKQLWDEWDQHRTIVAAEAGEITRMWLAGSFASGKLDPSDIDTTYLLRAEAFDRLDRETLAALDPTPFPDSGDKEAVRQWMRMRRRGSADQAGPGTPEEFSVVQRERLLQSVGLRPVASSRRLDVVLTGAATTEHTVRIAVLGQFLANFQDSVSAVAQALTGRPTTYSSIPRAVQESTSLSASAVFPSSFGMTLYGPQAEIEDDGLFPMPVEDSGAVLDDAVDKVLDIVSFSESEGLSDDLLTEELVPLGQRAMKHLGLLTTGLVEADLGLRITWQGRNGHTRSGEWSHDGARRVQYLCQQSQFGEPEAISIIGWLVSASALRGTVEIRTDSGDVVRAKTDEEVTPRLREYFDNRVEADAEVTTVRSVGGHVRKNYAILALRNIHER